jgi:hypothetical protein
VVADVGKPGVGHVQQLPIRELAERFWLNPSDEPGSDLQQFGSQMPRLAAEDIGLQQGGGCDGLQVALRPLVGVCVSVLADQALAFGAQSL